MRSLLFLAAVCCLVLSAYASPISRPEESEVKEAGRQAAAAAPAAPAASDDDDDDEDDDDDVDLDDPLSDDEDDDDDEEEEDEEEDEEESDDYLERFFDDLLGGGDDDDDEEESTGVQSVVASADTVAAAPAPAPVAAVEEAVAASEEVEAVEGEAAAEGEEPEAGQKEPASAEIEPAAASAEVAAAADAEDDEEEEDDITDALDPEDDDDDEEEEDDEDDDDDDLTDALGRNKQARDLSEEPVKKPPVPAAYIVKYNRFVDNILEKMNDILRRSYDPVNVKLQPIDASKKTTKPKKNQKKSNKRKTSNKKKNSARGGVTEKKNENETIREEIGTDKVREQINDENLNKITPEATNSNPNDSRALKEKASAKPKSTTPKPKPTKAKATTKPKPKPPTKTTTKKPANKNKVKTTEKSKPRAKGTLYGLSSLRRTGDVAVNIMSDHTTVKSNFAVGPLILRVEKEVGRKKEIKSATATTAEMMGKLTLRVNNEGVATLHSIKVLQPKQVRVDSNHERTRELVWQRSARIAHVVSEKLRSASKPMFLQQPVVRQ
ncbi:acidic repeat-containing protein-like [Maniola jurtina]|uniref:acidic repeat-containing protein-like n=1 Tax=Maniola jurtina TaxID=191418 RepID=UPI001E68DF71|nr:acidic repeat-containing protein-like [Maniola jurtina]